MADPAVSVAGLVRKYGDVSAVDGVSFEVAKGETFVLLGPKGSGKTTIIEILRCRKPPTLGAVKVLGRSVSDLASVGEIKMKIVSVPQVFSASERQTVAENLKHFANDSSLDLMGLFDLLEAPDKTKGHLVNPFAMFRQKVGIAPTMTNDAEIILLDDPTTGLDLDIKRVVWNTIKGWHGRGKTIILATPHPREAEQLADRIGILSHGKLVAVDGPEGLLGRFGGGKAIVFRNGGDPVFGTLRRFFDNVSMEGSDIVLPFERLRDLEVAFTALVGRGLEVEVAFRTPTIQDVFHKLTSTKDSST